MGKVIDLARARRRTRKQHSSAAVDAAGDPTLSLRRAIVEAIAVSAEANEKACDADFGAEHLVAVPVSIHNALVADSRALAEVRRTLRRHVPAQPQDECLGFDMRTADLESIMADAAEWAEQRAVRVVRRRERAA